MIPLRAVAQPGIVLTSAAGSVVCSLPHTGAHEAGVLWRRRRSEGHLVFHPGEFHFPSFWPLSMAAGALETPSLC
jgi:hypothetical protein